MCLQAVIVDVFAGEDDNFGMHTILGVQQVHDVMTLQSEVVIEPLKQRLAELHRLRVLQGDEYSC